MSESISIKSLTAYSSNKFNTCYYKIMDMVGRGTDLRGINQRPP